MVATLDIEIEQRIPGLGEVIQASGSAKDREKLTLFHRLDLALAIGLNNRQEWNSAIPRSANDLLEALPGIASYSADNGNLQQVMGRYIDRLQEFAHKDQRLKPVHEAYKQAFGGYKKK